MPVASITLRTNSSAGVTRTYSHVAPDTSIRSELTFENDTQLYIQVRWGEQIEDNFTESQHYYVDMVAMVIEERDLRNTSSYNDTTDVMDDWELKIKVYPQNNHFSTYQYCFLRFVNI